MSSMDDKNPSKGCDGKPAPKDSDGGSLKVVEVVESKSTDDKRTDPLKSSDADTLAVEFKSLAVDEAAVGFKSSGDQKVYTLKSSDGLSFVVEEAVAFKTKTIQHIVEDGCADNNFIPLPNVTGEVLAKVIEYCQKHVAFDKEASKAVDEADREKHFDEVNAWDRDFTKLDQPMLFHLIIASNYLDIPHLMDITCQAAADMIKDKSVEEVREFFNIQNDFTKEEEERYRKEHAWVFR